MHNIRRSLIAILTLSFLLSACDSKKDATATSKPASESLNIKSPYIRAMPPGQKVTAMFMNIENTSNDVHSLIAIETDASEHAEIHEHKHIDGMMQMGQVDQIIIDANNTTALAPGGYHIMLIGLKKDLALGQKVDLKLLFKDGSAINIQPEVQKIDVN